jgi:hypothetical protein
MLSEFALTPQRWQFAADRYSTKKCSGKGAFMVARDLNLAFFLITIASLLCGCVGNKSYRRGDAYSKQLPPSVDPIPASDTDCSRLPLYECVLTPKGREPEHFYLAHVEFDDMGELWSAGDFHKKESAKQSQLENAMHLIRKAQAEATQKNCELLVIAFVHGWHNNASSYDEVNKNLGSFKSMMQVLSSRGSLHNTSVPPVMVGIFLSWRGQSLTGDLAATYWNRRDAAVRVGGASMTEVVIRLMFETKGVPIAPKIEDKCELPPVQGKTAFHFAIIAHSFGARALEHAITQPMLSMILERQVQARECADDWNSTHPSSDQISNLSFPAPADLIVFLNAANDAFEAKETIEALKRAHVTVTRRRIFDGRTEIVSSAAAPLMMSITSDGDWATEKIMPLAQLLSSSALSFRRYDTDGCTEEGQLCDHAQSFYYRHSEASIKEMRSHVVILEPTAEASCKKWPYFWVASTQRCFCIDRNTDDPKDKCNQGIDQKSKFGVHTLWNDTPFYVIGVPSTLIPDHNDIFQDGTEELLDAISAHYDSFKGVATMTSPIATAP